MQSAQYIDLYVKLVTIGFPTIGSIVLAWIAYRVAAINKLTESTHVLVNSGSLLQMELNITNLEELLLAKPGDISVMARLDAARALKTDHLKKQAILDDRTR